jgi:transposase-like protein/predicted RNA-binding protein YlxR (DUF448 family)
MAQHFLLSAAARTLSLKEIYKGGEDAAYQTFRRLRWPQTNGEAVCPRCGCCETYDISTRRRFKCSACGHQFSVTSGTIFASRKMAFVDLLAAICIVVNGAKGISAMQIARDLDCQHKTAFVLCHKLREAMAAEIAAATELQGDVEIDGAHFGGHIRPENFKADRIDRRRVQSPRRRVVIAMRERKGVTRTFVVKHESEGVELAKRHASRMARMHADEATHWDALHAGWQVSRINHSEAYSDLVDACTNQAESFFSRLRRMVEGQHHTVSPQYLHQYAAHAAWLENNRRLANGALAQRVLGKALSSPVSRQWKGYWQRSS